MGSLPGKIFYIQTINISINSHTISGHVELYIIYFSILKLADVVNSQQIAVHPQTNMTQRIHRVYWLFRLLQRLG